MINIRREQPADYAAIYELVKQAFEHAEHTDHDEHNLVNRCLLYTSDAADEL